MGLRMYLSMIGLGSFLAWFAWGVIVWSISPREAGLPGFIMFYLTLGLALVGTMTILLSTARIFLLRRKVIEREIRTAFRHAILFALIVIFSLVFSAAGIFSIWYAILLISVASFIEYLFLQLHRGRR